MQELRATLEDYERQTRALSAQPGATEESYYPWIRQLLSAVLSHVKLPFEVRTGTSELRPDKGRDRPDFVLADGALIAAYGEAKTPSISIQQLAMSTDRDDQIGRYLARTGVVLVCNVGEIGLVLCRAGHNRAGLDRVMPADRELVRTASLWSTGRAGFRDASDLVELLQTTLLDSVPIGEPATLARVLALQAKAAKAALPRDLRGLESLLEDYKDALGLSFDLDDDEGREFFRSTLIQTAFYGLFAAWALWQREQDGTSFGWDRINRYLRIPFLAGLFHEFRNPSRLRHLDLERHLDRATDTLNRVDLEVFRQQMTFPSLSDGDVASAAMTYFYEPFLEAFDPALKKTMGVWYTPPEIVRYQVRRAHELLKQELGRPLGLADENVVLLDPCCGTGAYILEAARCIAEELRATGEEGLVGLSLLKALTSRIFGFEVLTAPFAIAQLQLYVMLSDLRAPPPNDQRLGIFLTNALTGWNDRRQLQLNFPELQQEFEAAQSIKQDADIVVILGNPPYDRQAAVRMEEEAGLIDHYKGVTYVERRRRDGTTELVPERTSLLFRHWGVRKQLLNDLYIRFYRLAEREIAEERDFGLVSLITNSSWLTGRSHPIMRESLLRNFHEIWIDNLNGDKYRTGKVIPAGIAGAGTADQSVFTTESDPRGIQTGVAIATFLKRGAERTKPEETVVQYRDFWGKAALKRRQLLSAESAAPYRRLTPTRQNRWRLAPHAQAAGYEAWPSLEELFPIRMQGINPNRGITGSLIDVNKKDLTDRIAAYMKAESFVNASSACPGLAIPRARYAPEKVWQSLRKLGFDESRVSPYLLFPFDQRWIYYEDRLKLLNEPRETLGANVDCECFLIAVPEPRKVSEARPLFSRTLLDLHVHDRGSVAIPAVVRIDALTGGRLANISPEIWAALREAWDKAGGLEAADAHLCANELIHICLAIMNSPAYRMEHASALGADWARVPIPRNPALARQVGELGRLVAALMDCSTDASSVLREILGRDKVASTAAIRRSDGHSISADDLRVTISYFGAAPGRFVPSDEVSGELWINNDVYLANVPTAAWRCELGGYQTIRKWLGYRHVSRLEGRPMTLEEQRWLRNMILRLTALSALEAQMDELYSAASEDALIFGNEMPSIQAAE
ncbi:type ISP restriction/modification enzyme [Mesorhizobium amorphae]|uniref:type ISP restriction/modification enzyme n=1 Tax=Mesorhizobium amorphae TaxID=71433 RepID=UPI00030AEE58|nr:type ISP restriction/modification enzyme [Mesorhizobium amorphae]